MSSRQNTPTYKLGTFSTDWQSNPQFSWDYRNALFTLIWANSAVLTVKFLSSNQEISPDFSQAASATNQYTTTEAILMSPRTSIDGDTGVVYAWTEDGVTRYEINENVNRWVWVQISWYSAWDVTIDVQLANNQ